MKEWSDEELDKLFRASAEEFEAEYQPSDWQSLRRRLDEADGVAGGGWLKSMAPWVAGVLLLLLGGMGVHFYGNEAGIRRERAIVSASEKGGGKPDARTARPPGAAFSKSEAGETDENVESKPQSVRIKGKKAQEIAAAPEVAEKKKELPRNPVSVSGVRKPTDPERRSEKGAVLLLKKALTRVDEKARNTESMEEKLSELAKRSALRERASDDEFRSLLPALTKLASRATLPMRSAISYPAVAYAQPAVAVAPKPEESIPKWSVRLGLAPDLSMAGTSEMTSSIKPGSSASLLVDVNVRKRWVIQTGVIMSLKNYVAMGGEYTWPSEWKYKQIQRPSSVDGSCRVIEIPLNIRFDIRQSPTSRWFVGAGVSSYNLLKEKYEFNYDSYDPKTVMYGYSYNEKLWAILCHANASVGYERRLTQRLSILAEPYVRIPLRKLGVGQVNLFTGGVWFSVRYTPVFRR